MGCFLACFGFKHKTNKKKRRIRGSKTRSPSGKQDHQRYVPLDSDVVSLNLVDIKENCTSDSNPLNREKQKEAAIQKIKKKVRFNLNVKAYEPIPHNDDEEDDDLTMYISEGANWEFQTQTKNTASLHYEEEDIISSNVSTHRYQNCRDSYDEEDNELMMMLHDNDLDFDEIEDEEDDDDEDDDEDQHVDGMSSPEDFPWEYKSNHVNDEIMITEARKSSVRDRSQYVCSVLNPVENLSQWKVVKGKGVIPPQYMNQKENLNLNI